MTLGGPATISIGSPASSPTRCRLVALTHCSNVTGALTDVASVVAAARAVGAKVMLDGAQRAPHGPLDLPKLDVDFSVRLSKGRRNSVSKNTGDLCLLLLIWVKHISHRERPRSVRKSRALPRCGKALAAEKARLNELLSKRRC